MLGKGCVYLVPLLERLALPAGVSAVASADIDGATFIVGDVTDLSIDELGMFEFFFDIGCFQHLDAGQRRAAGRGITALATPGATLLMMAFSRPTPIGSFVKGVSPHDVQAAFPDWDLLSVDDAERQQPLYRVERDASIIDKMLQAAPASVTLTPERVQKAAWGRRAVQGSAPPSSPSRATSS